MEAEQSGKAQLKYLDLLLPGRMMICHDAEAPTTLTSPYKFAGDILHSRHHHLSPPKAISLHFLLQLHHHLQSNASNKTPSDMLRYKVFPAVEDNQSLQIMLHPKQIIAPPRGNLQMSMRIMVTSMRIPTRPKRGLCTRRWRRCIWRRTSLIRRC